MSVPKTRIRRSTRKWLAAGAGLAAAAYGTCVAGAWVRYGAPSPPGDGEDDPLLDRVMPAYDIVERHHVRIAAPAAVTFAVASEIDLMSSLPVRAIFRAREAIMGGRADTTPRPRAFMAFIRSIGWGVLAERPGQEIVMGAVTQPWLADVVFRALPPDEFPAFAERGFVKIAWTLRADPLGDDTSVFRTETRAVATDAGARAKFRRYWSLVSPGIVLIRWLMLGPVKREAERRARRLP